MKIHHNTEEIRWQVAKAKLDDSPEPRKKLEATSKKQKTKLSRS
jgi:hypothetical protein